MFFRKKAQSWEKYMARENDYPIEKVSNEVNEKLSFMGIDQVTCTHIRKVAPVINRAKGEIVKEFYERITAVSKLKELIDEHSTVEKLKQTMVRYLEQFLKADIDEAYLESRFIVGKIHSKINLTIEHFLAAHHFLTQSMITVVMTELNNRPDEMIKTVLSIQKLAAFDQQVISEVYMGDTFKSFLFSVSDTLDHTTQLDTSKQLIEEMDHMNEEVFNVSSATEQVSASILEVTNHSIKVSEGTDDALQSAERSREVVDETVKDINEVGAVYEQVLSQVELLNEEIDKTHHVVELIKEITEQTNLLALNASIEAARAGEHGAGFAVVAQEVRNLAEHTNEQTIQISRNMASLQNVANVVTGQMSNTEELIKKSVDGAQVADQALDEIVTTMQEINESTAQIAAMSEEQTSAVSEIAQSTANVLNLSKTSQTIANTTAKVIFEISELMEKNRQQFMSTNIELQSKDIVRVAKTDHLLWKWRVYNMLLGLENLDSTEVTSHTMCRLGKWYYGSLTEHLKDSATFKQLEEPHIAVHEYAQQAAEFYEQDDYEAADRVFDELTEASNTVIELLTQLENEL